MQTAKQRYQQAHEKWFKETYPTAYADGHYAPPKYPITTKANGLTLYILNYINWMGYRATRISTSGRVVGGKYIYGQTRRGTADISATIKGRSCMFEIKVGKDKASEFQLKEQAKEKAAGGEYYFTHSPEQFFEQYDEFLSRI
jgi:hypothetical protein